MGPKDAVTLWPVTLLNAVNIHNSFLTKLGSKFVIKPCHKKFHNALDVSLCYIVVCWHLLTHGCQLASFFATLSEISQLI